MKIEQQQIIETVYSVGDIYMVKDSLSPTFFPNLDEALEYAISRETFDILYYKRDCRGKRWAENRLASLNAFKKKRRGER